MTKETLFYNRLKRLVQQSGKSINQIERELGYSRNALHNYKNGVEPSGTRLIEISNYFGVTPEYLIGKDSQSYTLPLKNFFNRLNTKQKCEMIILCKDWLEY
ncbi:helix-turn-helix domain-containing protein [Lactococcus lactis]|uniref:helix-turn-helix domain-containing protein n=1 Tax=Lactococcus lactis TaxID=1358 RepID=UPI001D183EE6|nr:helix-turn-helix transcriptional regulator [Lactococcus lactis]MCC4119919.1 helix-turn-helix domain-containing protein [Lactococcus lactis]